MLFVVRRRHRVLSASPKHLEIGRKGVAIGPMAASLVRGPRQRYRPRWFREDGTN